MSFTTFAIGTIVLLAVYYLLNIVYDLSKKDPVINGDNEKSIDVQQVFIEENNEPINAMDLVELSSELNDNPDEITIPKEPEPASLNFPDTSDIDLTTTDDKQKNITNITNHSGYTPTSLNELFKEVINDGYNPFNGVTAKMV